MLFLLYFLFQYLSNGGIYHQGGNFPQSPEGAAEQQRISNYVESVYKGFDKRIHELSAPSEVREKLGDELKRIVFANWMDAESAEIRKFLNTVLGLPWGKKSKAKEISLEEARRILDEDHYGLDEVKERILDYLAVCKKIGHEKAPILCFVGPPGVGKTSISKSIAKVLGKKFERISLGGVHDESVIRGMPRYYIGAKLGRIMGAIEKADTSDPVILLDEVDKLTSETNSWNGDPSAALLEVLDPEQNKSFQDSYMDLPFDLSSVTFITTANDLSRIPRPLKDRMEVIEIESYSSQEKIQIAQKSLLPKILEKKGLRPTQLILTAEVIEAIIQGYTLESGVRELERQIEKICQKIIRKDLETPVITKENLAEFLGPQKYTYPLKDKEPRVGSVVGCYWSEVGGGVLIIEGLLIPGTGETLMSGNLGEMTKESMKAAVTYIKSRAEEFGIPEKRLNKNDLHLHFPDIGRPKDGPSAGLAVACLTYSIFTEKPLRQDVALTGELSLHGKVLPVGGIKGKLTAAKQYGVRKILLPIGCMNEAAKLSEMDKKDIEIIFVETFDEALKHLL